MFAKRAFGVLLTAFFFSLGLQPLTARAEDLGVWIGGVQITDDNLSGSGWSYAKDTQTLTLNNYTWSGSAKGGTNGYYCAIASDHDLTICLQGTNTIAMTPAGVEASCFTLNIDGHNLTFEGSGSLTLDPCSSDAEYSGTSYSGAVGADTIECSENFTGSLRLFAPDRRTSYSYGAYARRGVTVNGGNVYIESSTRARFRTWGINTGQITVDNATLSIKGGTTHFNDVYSYGLYYEGDISFSVTNGGSLAIDSEKDPDIRAGSTAVYAYSGGLNVHVDDDSSLRIGGKARSGIGVTYNMSVDGPMTIATSDNDALYCNYSGRNPAVNFTGAVTAWTSSDGGGAGTPVTEAGYLNRFSGYKRIASSAVGTVYPINVAGFQVRESNAADVLGDGTVSYDASSKTLTLDGANITGAYLYEPYYESKSCVWCSIYTGAIPGLKIRVAGDSTIAMPGLSYYSHGILMHSYEYSSDTWLDAELELDADLTVTTAARNGVGLSFTGHELTVSGSGTLDLAGTYTGSDANGYGLYSYGYWETNAVTLTDTATVNVSSPFKAVVGNSCLHLTVGENAAFHADSTNIGMYELQALNTAGTVTVTSTGGNGNAVQDVPVTVTGGSFTASGTNRAIAYSSSSVTASEGLAIFAGDDAGSAVRQAASKYTGTAKYVNVSAAPPVTVTITPADPMNAAASGGSLTQTGVTAAMTTVTYTPDEGFWFPTDYASLGTTNGVTVARSGSDLTISGTPVADTAITLAAASAKTKEATPTAVFVATGADTGTLSGLVSGYQTVKVGTADAQYVYSTTKDLTGLSECTISIVMKAYGDGRADSDPQDIDVTKATAPAGLAATACTTSANDDGTITGVDTSMEYQKSGDSGWTAVSGSTVTGLSDGIYLVRVKAQGTVLASASASVSVAAYAVPTFTVSFASGGGSGSMTPVSGISAGTAFNLPDPLFGAPGGMTFDCWSIEGTDYGAGAPYTVNGNVTATAKWKASTAHTHSLSFVPESPAGCETDGAKAHYICSGCDKWFEDALALVEITNKSTAVLPKTGHRWDGGVIVTEATSDTPGMRLFTCRNDSSHTKTEIIRPANGVKFVPDDNTDYEDREPAGRTSGTAAGEAGKTKVRQNAAAYTGSAGTGTSGPAGGEAAGWMQDERGWHYTGPEGSTEDGWARLSYNGAEHWYAFDENGTMLTGWYRREDGVYYLNPVSDGTLGAMLTGWQYIDGKWYYFEPEPGKNQGHLYVDTVTPDGYRVDEAGAWTGQ